jgi:hypothetical protein
MSAIGVQNGHPRNTKQRFKDRFRTLVSTASTKSAKAINFELEASSFPNWDGVVQKRPFSGDEMRFTNSSGSSGGSVLVILQRSK